MSDFLNLQNKCKELIRNEKVPVWSSGSFLSHIVIQSEEGNWIEFDSDPQKFALQTLNNFKNSFQRIDIEVEKKNWDSRTMNLPQVLYENDEKKKI